MTHPKTRVLFVDDEPLVLSGLQRMLRPLRNEWEMTFVDRAERALETLAKTPHEVVVSDMRMPGMDGAQFLAKVKDLHPGTVRLILSGHADKDLIMKCVGTAHQFLAKPCEPEGLRAAIQRASSFGSSLKNERLKELVGRMDRLPSVPSLLNDIVERLQHEHCTVEEIGAIISRDIAMSAKLLKLVNSAFFGLRREVSDPADAISYLGLDIVKALVLAVQAFAPFEGQQTGPVSLETLWAHSLEVAGYARKIADAAGAPKSLADDSFIAGLLHDIGKLVLSANIPEEYATLVVQARIAEIPLLCAEENAFGTNHADIGGYLLNLWGLPTRVVDAIGQHHLSDHSATELSPVVAVQIADMIVHHRCRSTPAVPLDEAIVEKLGLGKIVENLKQPLL